MLDDFRDSRVSRLYVMDYVLFQVHSNGRIIVITGSLIETDDGKRLNVNADTAATAPTPAGSAPK